MNAKSPNIALLSHVFRDATAFSSYARKKLLLEPPVVGAGHDGPSDFDLNPGVEPEFSAPLAPAAVLIPVLDRPGLPVLLTERTAHLKAHAGQIAFPGGRAEAEDATPLATALRETREETGLDALYVEPLGYLEPYRTGTGFMITPAVALVRPGFLLAPDPNEVQSLFEVPLAFLMDDRNHRIDTRSWRGASRKYYAMPYGERYIWGATAGIIRALYRRLQPA